jgi:hypothetical protein
MDRQGQLARQIIWERPVLFALYNGLDDFKGLEPNMAYFDIIATGSELPAGTVGLLLKGDLASAAAKLSSRDGSVVAGQLYIFAFTALLIGLSVIGTLILVYRRSWLALVLLAVVPALLMYAPGYISNSRFRAPVEPLLAILAAAALDAMVTRIRQRLDTRHRVTQESGMAAARRP